MASRLKVTEALYKGEEVEFTFEFSAPRDPQTSYPFREGHKFRVLVSTPTQDLAAGTRWIPVQQALEQACATLDLLLEEYKRALDEYDGRPGTFEDRKSELKNFWYSRSQGS